MTGELFVTLDVYHDTIPQPAALNMAIDEALLHAATVPSIRFYRWSSPALSFGYFGRFADVVSYAAQRDLVRRWTGGGIVFHGDDLTYSIVIPSTDPLFGESSMSIYEKIHRALAEALVRAGQLVVVAAIGDCGAARSATKTGVNYPEYNGSYRCFSNPVPADVMLNGRKIAGAAQRRTRAGLLHQGSIQGIAPEPTHGGQLLRGPLVSDSSKTVGSSRATQPVERTGRPSGTERVELENGLAHRFSKELSSSCNLRDFSAIIRDRAEEIAARKYGTQSWLRKW